MFSSSANSKRTKLGQTSWPDLTKKNGLRFPHRKVGFLLLLGRAGKSYFWSLGPLPGQAVPLNPFQFYKSMNKKAKNAK